MKKLTLIAFVLFIGIITSHAQVQVSPGLRGGLNLARLTNMDENGMKSDFYVGGLVEIKFNKFFTLQPELTYSRQGSKSEFYLGDDIATHPEVTYEIDYISFGAVAKFHFAGKGFHILAGPSLDIKTRDNFSDYDYKRTGADFSLTGGIGYTLPNGLTFEARFKQGLIDIYGYEGLDNDYYYDELVLNQVLQFGISYTFKGK